MRAWKAGNVGIANAPGAGVADDKVVYAWVPDLIRYYLGEEPLIPNVPTYRAMYDDERQFVIDNIGDLVVKPANESGGYGIVIGNRATAAELADAVAAIEADPRNWVAQPILSLSTVPTLVRRTPGPRDRAAPRRPAAVRPHRRDELRHARWADPGGAAEGLAGRELVAGRRQQGHVGRRRRVRAGGQGLMALLARVADRLYWGARYVERAEDTARIIRAYHDLVVDFPGDVMLRWEPLAAIAGNVVAFEFADDDYSGELAVLHFLIADRAQPRQHRQLRGGVAREPAHDARGDPARGVADRQRAVAVRRRRRRDRRATPAPAIASSPGSSTTAGASTACSTRR